MLSNKPVFAELFGLALFDLKQLSSFQKIHALRDDLLQEFTTSEIGDLAASEGVIIPISGIPGEYYLISAYDKATEEPVLKKDQIKIESTGWILNSSTGELTICGIGYLKKFDEVEFAMNQKFVRLQIPVGWSSLTISGGNTEYGDLVYELCFTPHLVRPSFAGKFTDQFNILDD